MKTATIALSALVLAAACQNSGGSSSDRGESAGTLTLEVTDAPMDLSIIKSVVVEIDQVSVHKEADGETDFEIMYEGEPVVYELSNLRNGVTQGLASSIMEPGLYRQIRLRMTSGRMRLADGREFSTEDGTLKFTSQKASGLKLFLDPPVEVSENKETAVLLDFQLHRTFTPIPAGDVEKANSFTFHPVVRIGVRNNSGDIDGIVQSDDGSGVKIGVEGALVHLVLAGETDPDQSIATTITEADGTAAFLGVAPGTYDLIIEHDGETTSLTSITVTAEAVTTFTADI